MKLYIVVISLFLASLGMADSFFFQALEEPDMASAKIEGETLHLAIKIKKLPLPKVEAIEIEENEDGTHIIRAFLRDPPERGWLPMIKLEDRILAEDIRVTTHQAQYASYFEIVASDKKRAESIARSLATLLGVRGDRLRIPDKQAEQGGGGQPATRPESK
jgi:hypothetical protein